MTSIQHTAPSSDPRRETSLGLFAPPANHWLRMIYAALLRIRCLLVCVDGTQTSGPVAVSDAGAVELLAAEGRSKSVAVTNAGANPAAIYEGGGLVTIVPPGVTRVLPLDGLFVITAKTHGAGATEVTATRTLRCACGDTETEYSAEPVGSFLL